MEKNYFDEEMLPKISSDAEEEEEEEEQLEEEKENVENSSRSDNTEEENILDDESFSEGNEVQDVLSAFSTDDDVNDNKVFFSPIFIESLRLKILRRKKPEEDQRINERKAV